MKRLSSPARLAPAPANTRAIAAACGVSHVTVSRALRDSPNVSPDTKARVLAAARRLGYRPNPLVQAFAAQARRGRAVQASCNLAWLVSEPSHRHAPRPWIRPYLEGARARAHELGYTLDSDLDAHDLTDVQLSRVLRARGIRAVLIPHLAWFDRLPYQDPALVTVGIGENPVPSPMHTVLPDYFRNLTRAFDHLLALGYRRIGYCEHLFQTVLSQGAEWGAFLWNQQRLPATRRLPPLTGLRPGVRAAERADRERFLRWFEKHRPDVLLTTAYHVADYLAHAGLRAPADVGLAHLSLADETPGWSGIDHNPRGLGAAAVDLASAHLLRNEGGIPVLPKFSRLPGLWVHGRTTRAPAAQPTPTPGHLDPVAPLSHGQDWVSAQFFAELAGSPAAGDTRRIPNPAA